MGLRYKLQYRHQDEGWQDAGEEMADEHRARERAWEMAASAIVYGMSRVVDKETGEVLVTHSAGANQQEDPNKHICYRCRGRL